MKTCQAIPPTQGGPAYRELVSEPPWTIVFPFLVVRTPQLRLAIENGDGDAEFEAERQFQVAYDCIRVCHLKVAMISMYR